MNKKFTYISIAFALLICGDIFSSDTLKLTDEKYLVILDSVEASEAIIHDEKDHFFDRITKTEMEIQTKHAEGYTSRENALSAYLAFMKKEVENFSDVEIGKVKETFQNIAEKLVSINPDLLPPEIILIKTKGNHYGDGVYYTRENKIIIPANELENFNPSGFEHVMLHEVFHIFSRDNEDIRNALYNLIGFEKIRGTIILPPSLGKTKLLNPDGTTDYMIKLNTNDGKSVFAYPVINSQSDNYLDSKPNFFQYLKFSLYELIPGEDGIYNVVLNDKGETTIPFERIPSFFTTIKDNTNYIIHPDEIMADNYVYAVYYLADGNKTKEFSDEGMKLIEEIGRILKAYKRK